MSRVSDTEQIIRESRPWLTRRGQNTARFGLHLWRWGSAVALGYIVVRPEAKVEGITKPELQRIMEVHEAKCEQIILESREQIRELNRRMDLLLRQRWQVPPRGGDNLMRKDQ